MRYAGQKRRSTTTKSFELSDDKQKCISFGKKYHRTDEEFYIVNVNGCFSTVSIFDYNYYYKNDDNIEHWIFEGKRWKVYGNCK